ncbi:MAG: hypothetical protein ACK4K0_09800 [Flavobacteriales bacterium]
MKTPKVNIDRKPITSEEISKFKDFNTLLSQFPGYAVPFYKTGWFITTVAAVAVTVSASVFFATNNEEKTSTVSISTLAEAAPEKAISYAEDSKCYRAPIAEWDIPYSTFAFNVSQKQTLTTPKGMILKIKPHSFEFADGSALNCDEIELKYREFTESMEYWAAGIPMEYEVNGVPHQFESAGMIELWAYCNGNPLQLKQNKSIQLTIPQKTARPDMNYYTLDAATGLWTERNDLILSRNDGEFPTPTTQKNLVSEVDKTKKDALAELKPLHKEKRNLEKEIAQHKKTKPLEPKAKIGSLPAFNIDVLNDQFPELEAYKNTIFQITEEKYYKPEVFKKVWANMKLDRTEGGQYLVKLTSGNERENIPVEPVFEGKNYTEAKAKFDKLHREYITKLNEKEKEMEKVAREMEALQQVIKGTNDEAVFLKMEQKAKRKETLNKVTTALNIIATIPTLGIVNLDKPVLLPSAQKVEASLVNTNKVKIGITMLFLFDRVRNTIFPIVRSDQPVTKAVFFKEPKGVYNLLVIDDQNRIYHVNDDAFDYGVKSKTNEFTAIEVDMGALSQDQRNAILQAKLN